MTAVVVAAAVWAAGSDAGRLAAQTSSSGQAAAGVAPGTAPTETPDFLSAYRWRNVGPARGGRSIAVSGVKGRPLEAYFGAVGGGLWKTTDGGTEWRPVTDGQITSGSVGAVAVAESHPDVVYIGMGESCIRGNIQPGDGVYKSTDAGRSWTHVGFKGVDAISKIRIHPTNPDIVFVAAFGRYGVPSEERGVFKTTDGGKSWRKVLYRSANTGAVDVAIDVRNPQVVFAALWEAYRVEYQMSSGGPESGFFKSTDGGETWTEITRNPGLPDGLVGKIGIAISPADSSRVYALVENDKGGLYRTDDAGATWTLVNEDRRVRQRAFYYTHVHADTKDKDVVYMLNTSAFRSIDGGKTLASIGEGTHGDHHDMWVDPDDPEHVVLANDGGGAVSFNVSAKDRTWSDQDFSTAQFYHVITTGHLPFHVCGSQQDNSSLCVASDMGEGGKGAFGGGGFGRIPPVPPYPVGGGEPGYIAPDPKDVDVFFAGTNNGGFTTRYNKRTGELKEVGAYPRFFSGETSAEVKERWQWTFPIIFSPVDSTLLYSTSQRVWKTTNGGDTWEAISGDLSLHDPETMQESGGPITHDMNSPEIYGTVFSLAPGKKDAGIIWAGSDDGLVHVTRDGGKSWTNITPPDMPRLGRVSQMDASTFDDATAFMAVKKMLLGDLAPYIFRTRDYGRTWTKIVHGIPGDDYVHAVREDPVRKGLLYAGTQHGFYVSFDDGDRWQRFNHGLPDTQVSDVWVADNALAIATHGRGFYVLDDLSALRQYEPAQLERPTLYRPFDAIRGGERANLSYWLPNEPRSLMLEILDGQGQVVRSFPGEPPRKEGEAEEAGPRRGAPTTVPMVAGLNRFAWDLNSEPVVSFPGMILWGATTNGPMVLPGTCQVRLTVDGAVSTQPLVLKRHPLRPVSDADLRTQYDLASRIRDKVNEANNAVIQIRRIKQEVGDRLEKSKDPSLNAVAETLSKNLSAVEEQIYQVRNRSNQDPLNFPIRTNNRLASLLRVVVTGEGVPTGNVGPIFEDLKAELGAELDALQKVLVTDLGTFNRRARQLRLEAVSEK
jgi:photosystem II stability/assembly factor-like uncharacterized protein